MKIGDIDISNYVLFAPDFVVHAGLAMIHYTLTCEFTEIVLYEQDLMEDVLKFRAWATLPSSLFDIRWMDCSSFICCATELKLPIRSCITNSDIMNRQYEFCL